MAKPRKLQCLAEASLGNFEKGLVAELAVQVMPMQALQHRFCQHAKAPDLSQMIAGAIPHVHPGGAVHCSAMSEVHFRKPGLLQTGELTTELYVVVTGRVEAVLVEARACGSLTQGEASFEPRRIATPHVGRRNATTRTRSSWRPFVGFVCRLAGGLDACSTLSRLSGLPEALLGQQ